MDSQSIEQYILNLDDTVVNFPFEEGLAVYKRNDEMFALLDTNRQPLKLSLKCDPRLSKLLRENEDLFPSDLAEPKAIAEAYHKAKADGSNPELVKAVEQSLPTQEVKAEQPTVSGNEADGVYKNKFPLESEFDNILKISNQLGYKYSSRSTAFGEVTLYISVPANSTSTGPDLNYLPILKKGATFSSTGGQLFTLMQDVDFSESTNEIVVANVDTSTGVPTRYAVKTKGMVQSGFYTQKQVTLGSFERFIGIITEHFAGNFPVWLSPVQVKIIPISDKFEDYSKKIFQELKNSSVRVEIDFRNETLGAKIRDAQNEKVPYMIIVGQKEIDTNT
ncbi:hypothetical protein EBU94_07665, partial [bacterium]|nr:hypothetical protein [bacterium]